MSHETLIGSRFFALLGLPVFMAMISGCATPQGELPISNADVVAVQGTEEPPFCRLGGPDNQGRSILLVTVKNAGGNVAPRFATTVEFGDPSVTVSTTAQLVPEGSQELGFPIPLGSFSPDLGFRILVDSGHDVLEGPAGEANNSVVGGCIG